MCLTHVGRPRISTVAERTTKYIRAVDIQVISEVRLRRRLSVGVGSIPTDLIIDFQSFDLRVAGDVKCARELVDSVIGAGMI